MNKFITIYELLGLIKDGKAPKKIKYNNRIYVFAGNDYSIDDKDDKKRYWLITEFNYSLSDFLNEKVEIIDKGEDKPIIEKLNIESDSPTHFYIRNEYGTKCGLTKHSKIIADKLNEVIDYLNRKENN